MSVWQCHYCGLSVQRNLDDPISEAWVRARIADCETAHAEQLADHDGDHDALRLHLRNPALAHAIKTAQTEEGGQ